MIALVDKRAKQEMAKKKGTRMSPHEKRHGDITVESLRLAIYSCQESLVQIDAAVKKIAMLGETELKNIDGYTQPGRAAKLLEAFVGKISTVAKNLQVRKNMASDSGN